MPSSTQVSFFEIPRLSSHSWTRPFRTDDAFPFVSHQLVAGVSRMHAVPDPMFGRSDFAGGIENQLETHQRRIVLRGQSCDDVLSRLNAGAPRFIAVLPFAIGNLSSPLSATVTFGPLPAPSAAVLPVAVSGLNERAILNNRRWRILNGNLYIALLILMGGFLRTIGGGAPSSRKELSKIEKFL